MKREDYKAVIKFVDEDNLRINKKMARELDSRKLKLEKNIPHSKIKDMLGI